MFEDAHGFFGAIENELEMLKRRSEEQTAARNEELHRLRQAVERHRNERQDINRRLRYEFEEYVHRKIDVVQQEIDRLQHAEQGDDAEQQAMIEGITGNVERIKNNIFFLHRTWSKMISQAFELTPEPEEVDEASQELEKVEAVIAKRYSMLAGTVF